jgi:hypothetical protein
MDRGIPPLTFPFPVIFTLFTAFIGILLYAVAEVIEEEDAEFEALILEPGL